MPRQRPTQQPDLLSWQPPKAVESFEADVVRASSIAGKIARGLSQALKDCDMPRTEIAQRMSDYLGETVSANMLNAYASEAREEHRINLLRFVGLLHATRDRRLLELIAGMFGWTVIDRKYLPLIELAAIREKTDELSRQAEAVRRRARGEGVI